MDHTTSSMRPEKLQSGRYRARVLEARYHQANAMVSRMTGTTIASMMTSVLRKMRRSAPLIGPAGRTTQPAQPLSASVARRKPLCLATFKNWVPLGEGGSIADVARDVRFLDQRNSGQQRGTSPLRPARRERAGRGWVSALALSGGSKRQPGGGVVGRRRAGGGVAGPPRKPGRSVLAAPRSRQY